jgi:hypothetical protein
LKPDIDEDLEGLGVEANFRVEARLLRLAGEDREMQRACFGPGRTWPELPWASGRFSCAHDPPYIRAVGFSGIQGICTAEELFMICILKYIDNFK